MSVQITYFVHGTTTDNENKLGTGWLPGELSVLGIEQAKALRDQTADRSFDVVFCSDLKRAIDTAQYAFSGRFPIREDARLRECNYGDLNGKEEVGEKVAHIDTSFPNGESYRDVEHRISDFVSEIQKTQDGAHIAIVAHQGPQLALDVVLKGKSWDQAFAEDWRVTKSWQPGWEYTA